MAKNEGTLDRVIRGVIGLVAVLAALAVGAGSAAGLVLLAVAVIMLATAALGFCPLYRVLGLRTCPMPPDRP
jgi:hypothetical protein